MRPASPEPSALPAAADLVDLAAGPWGRQVARSLLAWYDAHRRALPWRAPPGQRPDPWLCWLSEVMLQQTRVEVVIPYFERFRRRFPTVEALAAASLDEVLALWSGLGFYGRARNLHRGARAAVAAGGLPQDEAGWRALPGVGPYMAGAVGSIALGLHLPAVDGNAVRVLSRLFGGAGSVAVFSRLAAALLPAGRAGDFNQAMMDLGSGICVPRRPRCADCPLAAHCRAHAQGLVEALPPRRTRRAVPIRALLALAVTVDGGLILGRRPAEGLYGGLWELPTVEAAPGVEPRSALLELARALWGAEPLDVQEVGTVEQTLSHVHLVVRVFRATLGPALLLAAASPYAELRAFAREQHGELPLSTLGRRCLRRALGEPG